MPVSDAARLLGHDGTDALRRRLRLGTLRGVAPRGDGNPTREWMASRTQIEAEALNRGRLAPPPAAGETLSTDGIRLQMLQADYVESLRAQLVEKDARIELLERLLVERDARMAERDAEMVRMRNKLRVLVDAEVGA
jgi:hypothetical protein